MRSREAWQVARSGQQGEVHLACTLAFVVVGSPKVQEGNWERGRNQRTDRYENPHKALGEHIELDALAAEDMKWLWLSRWM